MLKPTPPPYDIKEWSAKPFAERLRMVCLSWAMQGYGTPLLVYTFYLLKIGLYIGVWCFFCSFTPGMGDPWKISSWWLTPIAFQKAILWSMAFEGLGLGCGSGPLTGRYVPPFGGFLYFLRPGTLKMPFWPGLPILGGDKRTWLDVSLYAAHYVFLFRALTAPSLSFSLILPTIILLPILGLTDKMLYLSARGEHYYTAAFCFLFASQWVAANKLVWVAIWMGAATSKLNRHFPSVVCVMISNSPFTNFSWLRKLMYRDYPNDVNPSRLAHLMAHGGTLVEFTFPLVLLFSTNWDVTFVALTMMLLFHIFITSHVPMGVPIEWNFLMVYGAFFLFAGQASVSAFTLTSPLLIVVLAGILVVTPLIGNFFPAYVSFLCSMRYYAGNWPYSVWLFRGDSSKKLDQHLTKTAKMVQGQLGILYDEDTIRAVVSKVMAFRAMHLQGRVLRDVLPRAVDDLEDYEYLDGELIAGVALGWNFGDGHLHNLQLLRAIQKECNFEEGELRCVFVESQPMANPFMRWTIADANTGILEEGKTHIRDMLKGQPWPTP